MLAVILPPRLWAVSWATWLLAHTSVMTQFWYLPLEKNLSSQNVSGCTVLWWHHHHMMTYDRHHKLCLALPCQTLELEWSKVKSQCSMKADLRGLQRVMFTARLCKQISLPNNQDPAEFTSQFSCNMHTRSTAPTAAVRMKGFPELHAVTLPVLCRLVCNPSATEES